MSETATPRPPVGRYGPAPDPRRRVAGRVVLGALLALAVAGAVWIGLKPGTRSVTGPGEDGGAATEAGALFEGVIFDLDGVVADTEHFWDASWGTYARDRGAAWTHADSLRLQGLSVPEWSARLAEHAGGGPADAEGAADQHGGDVDEGAEADEHAPHPALRRCR